MLVPSFLYVNQIGNENPIILYFYYSMFLLIFQVIFVVCDTVLEEMLLFYIECRRICRIGIGQKDKNVQKCKKP